MHSYLLPAALAGKPMHGILRQGARLWFGCDQRLCLEEAGRVSVFGREEGLPEDAWDGIQISPDGSVWARSPKSIYRRAPGQTMFSAGKPGHRIERVLGRADFGPRRLRHGSNR